MKHPLGKVKVSDPLNTVVAAIVLALGGCASGPDVPASSISLSPNYHHADTDSTTDSSRDLLWWQQFGDAQLAHLVERTVMANYDIRLAMERARQARASTVAAQSRLLPSVNLTASISESQTGLPIPLKQSIPDTKATRAGVDVAWEMDVFGGARAAASAAEKDAAAARLGVSGARLIAASEVARQYFIWQGARQRLEILQSLLQTQRDTERLMRSRHQEGQASAFDVNMAAGEASNLQAALPQLRTLMDVTENRIAVLSGSNASLPVPELHAVAEFHWVFPKGVFAGQPADLLRRRPDVLAAEQQLSAASSRLAEAKANRFPKFFLSALFGQQELTLNNALSLPASRYANTAAAFVLPLFNGGRVQAGIEAQTAREQEALLSYEQSILGAIEDVESSLSALAGERQRQEALHSAVTQRQQAYQHAQSLFREGQIDLLQMLEVQRAWLATQLTLADSKAQRAADNVQLYKALGGGWQQLPVPAHASISTNASSGAKP